MKAAQAFRAHVFDMFEPQDHPDDFAGGSHADAPYDMAGWTLAYQMGVKFDRVLDGVRRPVRSWWTRPAAGGEGHRAAEDRRASSSTRG